MSTSLRSAYWSRDRSFSGGADYWVESAWLTLRPRKILGLRPYLQGYLQGENLGRNTDLNGDLREAYLEADLGDLGLKAGRQITVWGRADKINPTGNLSVADYRRLLTDDEEQRMGLGALQATYSLAAYQFSAIWQPEWRSPQFPLPPSGSGPRFIDEAPAAAYRQFGLKADQSGSGGLDWSCSYFHGFGKLPDLAPRPDGSAWAIGLRYPELDVFGADFATVLSTVGMRGELAYSLPPAEAGPDPLRQNPGLFGVLGLENSPFSDFTLTLQYLFRWVQDYRDPATVPDPMLRALALQSAINAQQSIAFDQGLALRPSWNLLGQTLQLEIAAVFWFGTQGQYYAPKASYAVTDHWKLVAGGQIFNGPDDSFFGRNKAISAGFLELRFDL
jgi:hypothetical protein